MRMGREEWKLVPTAMKVDPNILQGCIKCSNGSNGQIMHVRAISCSKLMASVTTTLFATSGATVTRFVTTIAIYGYLWWNPLWEDILSMDKVGMKVI